MLSKNVANDLSYISASRDVCVHYPTTINVLQAANRFSDILCPNDLGAVILSCTIDIDCRYHYYVWDASSSNEAVHLQQRLRSLSSELVTLRNRLHVTGGGAPPSAPLNGHSLAAYQQVLVLNTLHIYKFTSSKKDHRVETRMGSQDA
ncbi:hypothetical protein AVEN_136928-1 [Araneus ventricosus]|uniref:Uncharacterized protein n=1 Tax=Araneus ventricosus TaxID=182803 RepID=A0A4Y2BIL8_ARAVE|nr:hypothetical protein AVEN_136928-1 [Araneus ventricosus]